MRGRQLAAPVRLTPDRADAGGAARHAPGSPALGALEADSGALLSRRAPDEQAEALARASGGRLALAGSALLRLQRLHGNRHVQRVVRHAGHQSPALRTAAPVIQPALMLGSAGDRYEREADRMVGRVVGQTSTPGRSTQRQEDGAGGDGAAGDGARGGVVDSEVQQAVRRARGGGQPLPDSVRRVLEEAFGADFQRVRVHADAEADRLNRRLDALAFTFGTDIFFRTGEYDPGSGGGRAVIAHELTHVQQQAGAPPSLIQRLISASQFRRNTGLTARAGKSGQTFDDLVAGLQTYETTGLPGDLLRVHGTATLWLRSPEAATSSRRAHVAQLVQELEQEGHFTGIAKARARAKKTISKSGLTKSHKDRAKELIDAPDAINQTAFGVCGLVSVLRPMLTYDPQKFASLAVTALTDGKLDKKKWKQVFAAQADAAQKALGAEFEFLVSQWLVRHGPTGEVSQTVLSRGGGGTEATATKRKQYTAVFSAQKTFSGGFGITGWENVLGHFAMTTGGLNYLLTAMGAPASYKINVRDFWPDYQLAKGKAGDKGQVIASVRNVGFYQKGGKKVDVNPPAPTTKYIHWVMIEDVQPAGNYFNIKLWTWARFYYAKVHRNVAANYFYSFVAVSFD
jgi:hypothetical protein